MSMCKAKANSRFFWFGREFRDGREFSEQLG